MSDLDLRERINTVATEVAAEVEKAMSKFAAFNSPHEGKAVIEEELDELWEHVRANTGRGAEARKEAIQVAAMGIRYVLDLCERAGGGTFLRVAGHPGHCFDGCGDCLAYNGLRPTTSERADGHTPQNCSREFGHDGPCNGWPCVTGRGGHTCSTSGDTACLPCGDPGPIKTVSRRRP